MRRLRDGDGGEASGRWLSRSWSWGEMELQDWFMGARELQREWWSDAGLLTR
jgi:hypothetical protein